jgi:hypothetical protein
MSEGYVIRPKKNIRRPNGQAIPPVFSNFDFSEGRGKQGADVVGQHVCIFTCFLIMCFPAGIEVNLTKRSLSFKGDTAGIRIKGVTHKYTVPFQ